MIHYLFNLGEGSNEKGSILEKIRYVQGRSGSLLALFKVTIGHQSLCSVDLLL